MPDIKENLLNLANSSGFLFQLGVEQVISTSYSSHGKRIVAREHRWQDLETGVEGFIDLVLTTGTHGKMVLECKRVRDAQWIFLVGEQADMTRKARVLWSGEPSTGKQAIAWDEFNLVPPSLESQFCIVRGQSSGQQPMLERISSIVVRASEALATEEMQFPREPGRSGYQFYFPVIVTTAELLACKFDPLEIDLLSGELPDASFEEVPFVRFTKSLSSAHSSSMPPRDLQESARESQRTVFVISVKKLADVLLGKWEFPTPPSSGEWPWGLPIWSDSDSTSA